MSPLLNYESTRIFVVLRYIDSYPLELAALAKDKIIDASKLDIQTYRSYKQLLICFQFYVHIVSLPLYKL